MSKARAIGPREVRDAVPLFAALGDPTRLQLLTRLSSGGPRSITELSEGSPITRQAITKHLRVLGRAGLVRSHRRGREHIWELEPQRFAQGQDYLERIASQWDRALERLRRFVELDD